MDRSIVLIFGIALLVLQSTLGAELNSEATLNCNGKEFKCVNSTHYQPCSLTERSGQQPQYMINGNVLPCVAGKMCSDESVTCCGSLTEIPVKVETAAKEDAPAAEGMSAPSSPLKSLAVEEPAAAPVAASTVAPAAKEEHPAEATKSAEPAAAPANASAPVDMLKTEDTASKKKFSFKGLKKVGPMRLVKGFRASTWRPKISLDSQKDVADSLRKRIYERRNKYEKFVDVVLGKATPVQSSAKQPAPGQPAADPVDCESNDTCEEDYDSCDDGSCDDYEDDDCSASNSCDDDCSSSDSCDDDCSSSDSCDDDDDDCDDEDELQPGEAEAVWEEEEVEGGIEIVEECPDDDDDDCSDDECEPDDDYEYEDGIEETVQVNRPDDDCDDSDSCDGDSYDCSDDDSCDDSCDDSDEECKKRRKQQQANKNKKKKSGSKKKTGSKKTSSKKSSTKKVDGKKKTTEKKKVRYPPVQKIRKSLARALQNVTEKLVPAKARKGAIGNAASGLQNAVLNKVDDILSIKDNGGLFSKKKNQNDDTNTGCSIVEGWECPRQGRYAHPIDCQKYVQCSRQGPFNRELTNTVYECDDDEAYDPDIRSCTTDWSSCEALEQCLYHRQLIEDPSDESSYFICIRERNGFRESYNLYRRECTPGRVFDGDWGVCVDCDDSEKIKKAKKRRQQLKKQKKCQKKKAQKKKGQKKKTPSKKQ